MNLRNTESYSIGLDMGTGSVGWAAVDDKTLYPCHFRGIPTLGSRLFPNANTAAETRLARGQRRRYQRRRQRIDQLQTIFAEEVSTVDPDFFARLNLSRLWPEDKARQGLIDEGDRVHVFFRDSDSAKETYQKCKTIWHLRKYLIDSDEKEDIRLIYLALHNIIKYRGNFLREEEGDSLSAANANAQTAIAHFIDAYTQYLDYLAAEENWPDIEFNPEPSAMQSIIERQNENRAIRREELQTALGISEKPMAKNLAGALFSYKVEYATIFPTIEKGEGTKFEIGNEEDAEKFLSICPDEVLPSFIAMQEVYSAFILSSILKGNNSLSAAFIAAYDQHHEDLLVVKALIKEHLGKEAYNEMFRGSIINRAGGKQREIYDPNSLKPGTYTSYIEGDSHTKHEDFVKNLKKLLLSSKDIVSDSRYASIKERLESEDPQFLSKQKTRLNGRIPYQLHLEELRAIVDNQARFYPWLVEQKDLLEKIVSSRIPYYVGPLNTQRDPEAPYSNNSQNPDRKYAWATRLPGTEGIAAHPWNVEEVINTDKAASDFILRMTGTCTYLYGEPVLPRHSLLYEEFCVLNELNGARWADGSGKPHRFDAQDREEIMQELFRKRKAVSARAVEDWLKRTHQNVLDPHVSGMQGESGFESKLESYRDFCNILGVDKLEDAPLTIDDIEQIILWSTVFEDRKIVLRKLNEKYGDVLSKIQIKAISKKRYQGWGRLSRLLLEGIKDASNTVTIMDVLREGNPLPGKNWHSMILQEVLTDKKLGFNEEIEYRNKKHLGDAREFDLSEVPGSPALRRSINQTLRIVEEIVDIAGKEPSAIYVEEARSDDLGKKGKRTQSRYQKIKEALGTLRSSTALIDPELLNQLESTQGRLDNERMVLYFAQGGKSLYSGKPLDINRLSDYQVDHILPQCFIKDDSFENKALVLQEENQAKLDSLFLPKEWRDAQSGWWHELARVGLISQKKLKNLLRDDVSDRELQGFINRQLVETSQIIKYVRQVLDARYPETRIVTIKASLTSQLRGACNLIKCREINNYHHAHDAYMAVMMGKFIDLRYPKWQEGQDLSRIRRMAKTLENERKRQGEEQSSVRLAGESGFIVGSFLKSGFDKETGEVFKDTWDAETRIAQISRVQAYKQIFVTRMTEEQTGAFWDETVYSPLNKKEGKTLSIPLKESGIEGYLDPHRYGGYKKEQQSYYFLFKAFNEKEESKYFFAGVPVRKAAIFKANDDALQAYAENLASTKMCYGAVILRRHIPLKQKMLIDGTEYYLGGKAGESSNWIDSAFEYLPSTKITILLNRLFKEDQPLLDGHECLTIYSWCGEELKCHCRRLSEKALLNKYQSSFISLSIEEKNAFLKSVILKMVGTKRSIDYKAMGGPRHAVQDKEDIAAHIERIIWIDQSITGMHEKKSSLEDLEKWASERS